MHNQALLIASTYFALLFAVDIPPADPGLQYWVREGGAIAIVALLIYFYRRDWKTLNEYWQQQNTMMTQIVQSNTTQLARLEKGSEMMHGENRVALEAVRNRIHELTRTIQNFPYRRKLDKMETIDQTDET